MSTVDPIQEIFNQQLREQAEADAKFREEQAVLSEQRKTVYREMMEKRFHQVDMTPELLEVLRKMRENPLIVPKVNQFIDGLLEKIKGAIEGALNG